MRMLSKSVNLANAQARVISSAIATAIFVSSCVSASPGYSPESQLDFYRLEKRFHQVYQEAIANADQHQQAILEKEYARWFVEREKLKNDPDSYIASTQQETRFFAGIYDEQ
jgi:hypothetical protein